MKKKFGYRWYVVIVFFFFMLLHQSDKLLISPLTVSIMDTFHINEAQMGLVSTGALLVAVIFYPLWGYLYDHFARSKLLALAAFIWGSTTWLNAIAPNFGAFLATRATTGIDDSSYSGMFSLISDYFHPNLRGKIYGLLMLAQPLGYMVGMLLALSLKDSFGWRNIFFLTGGLGIVVAGAIFFIVREPARGQSEPEMENIEEKGQYKFNMKAVRELFHKRSLILLYAQGFFGIFPWNVIQFWFFAYLEKERHYSSDTMLFTMAPAILILAAGYFVGGMLGDWLFKRNLRGRLLVAITGIILGAIGLSVTLQIPHDQPTLFMISICISAIFIPFPSANVLSTVYDITLPEIRSTASAVESFIEEFGAVSAPALVGILAVSSSLENAILVICLSAWTLCTFFFIFATYYIPKDIRSLREQMKERAQMESKRSLELEGGIIHPQPGVEFGTGPQA